ncbi:MAG: hypothetical protein KBS94_08170, partial [Prevotella sp.]|nr:hypothetical protein [Candidatus Equicola faecalis]
CFIIQFKCGNYFLLRITHNLILGDYVSRIMSAPPKDNRKLKFKAFSPLVFSFGKMRGLFSALSINSDWRK